MRGEPSTRRGRASRERIVERAADLFAERGIAATSVDEVLAAAKAGKGQFYHYFRGRDQLAAAAVGYRCAAGGGRADRGPRERVVAGRA
ncbi:MAG TPA: helix-turn-helix domain-containing protein [Streptosporangiaceae bacterium]|nr:helix-turn-helix domain-containing protein [Streptosporangiaceae bacterium]